MPRFQKNVNMHIIFRFIRTKKNADFEKIALKYARKMIILTLKVIEQTMKQRPSFFYHIYKPFFFVNS